MVPLRCLRKPDNIMEIEVPTINPGRENGHISNSNHTENVPLLLSSGNQSSPSNVPNGGMKSINMLENPYYLSSQDYSGHKHNESLNYTEYSYIPDELGVHTETAVINNSHTALITAPNRSAIGALGTSEDKTSCPQSTSTSISAKLTSSDITSAEFDSYCKGVELQMDHSAMSLSCENISAYVRGSVDLKNNDTSAPTGVDEFGYCPNV